MAMKNGGSQVVNRTFNLTIDLMTLAENGITVQSDNVHFVAIHKSNGNGAMVRHYKTIADCMKGSFQIVNGGTNAIK